jgi:hypothetical protein
MLVQQVRVQLGMSPCHCVEEACLAPFSAVGDTTKAGFRKNVYARPTEPKLIPSRAEAETK